MPHPAQGVLDAAGIPPLPKPLREFVLSCGSNAKGGAKGPVQPTARDLTAHMPVHLQADAMARIRCVCVGGGVVVVGRMPRQQSGRRRGWAGSH